MRRRQLVDGWEAGKWREWASSITSDLRSATISRDWVSTSRLEAHFRLAADYSVAKLTFSDWQNRTVQVNFQDAFKACIFHANGYRGLPCARLVEVLHSEEVSQLLESGLASPAENLHHYVISSNEDGWAEFVASGYSIVVTSA